MSKQKNLLTVKDVADFLNDFPETNRLIAKPEFSPERVLSAIRFTIDRYNETHPQVKIYDMNTFPYRTLLLYGVCSHLFLGEATFQERNHLPYSSSGISVDDTNHAQMYLQFHSLFDRLFEQKMKNQKTGENTDSGWGIISSDYSYI